MFNNIKLIDQAFDKVYEIEKKVNYEYEPMYNTKNKGWRRNLFFKELKKDFIKDVTEFGFCPYLPKACEAQQKNKNISKFSKIDNYSKLDYIKSLYKKINQDEVNNKKKEIENLNFFNSTSNKKVNKYYLTSLRMRRNKSSIDVEFLKNKKKLLLRNVHNPRIKLKKNLSNLNDNKTKNKITTRNSSMLNICFKKNKSINKSQNDFVDAESFIYEPEKMFLRHNQNYNRENDSYEEDTTNLPKRSNLFNKYPKKRITKVWK